LNEETIISKIYHDGFALSKIANIVFRAAEKGDSLCRMIIKDAAGELAHHFIPLKNRIYTIALMGSLFSDEKLLELELKKIIKAQYPNISIIKPNFKPVWGAIQIANSIASEAKQT
jgi:N-acetylglucosamine kinase-like BadF-type ATPase